MKSRKGFTLVELLGAIVILSLLSLVAIPVVTNVVKGNKQKLYDIQMKNIESAAKAWGSDNLSSLPDSGESTTISLEELQKAGYVEKDIKDPKTGETLKNITITICNINNQYTYTTSGKCDIPDESNTSLTSLTVNGKDILSTRTITLPIGTTSIEINATAASSKATVTGIGTKEVKEGKNNFSIIVTAEDGSKTSYDIEVIITAASTNANLSKLGLTNCTLNPTFNSNTIKYTCTVENSVTETTVSATASDSNASISGLGTKKLNVGSNQIDVVVTAQNSTVKKTYSIYVTRKKSSDATLKSLNVSGCTLSPTFSSGTTSYTCTVENSVTSVNVNATANNSNATVTGTGSKTLNVGENTISVKTTAEDGTTTKTYTVKVTRKEALDNDTSLSIVAINGSQKIYILPNGTTTAQIQVRATSEKATVTIDGIVDDDQNYSSYFEGTITGLKTGTNTIKVKVVAESGDEKIHTITITVAGENTLKSLSASEDCTLSPTFTGSTTEYTCNVGRDTNSINVSATPTYDKATVTGTGSVELNSGENKIYVKVTAEDNVTKTYTITVNKSIYTSESCFEFDKSTNTITGYNCYFGNDKNLPIITDIIIPYSIDGNYVYQIGDSSFYNKGLTKVIITGKVNTISPHAFQHNDINYLTIPNTVINMGYAAFNDNQLDDENAFIYARNEDGTENKTTIVSYGGSNRGTETAAIEVPEGVTTVYEQAFSEMGLNNISLPTTLTTIGWSAFSYNNLKTLTIPASVSKIDDLAVEGNSQLTYIYNTTGRKFYWSKIIDGTEKSDSYTFGDIVYTSETTNKDINIDSTGANQYLYGDGFEYTVYYGSINKCSVIGYENYDGNQSEKTIIIPEKLDVPGLKECTVARIGLDYNYYPDKVVEESNFAGTNIISLTLPSTVSAIYKLAFVGNNISTVNLNNVTYIGESAFYGNKLTSLTLDSESYIGESAFSNNILSEINLNYSIGTNITSISKNAFANQNATQTYIKVKDAQYNTNELMGLWNTILGTSGSFVCATASGGKEYQFEYCNNSTDSTTYYVTNPNYTSN